jgi:hypothetical protein
VILRHRGLVMSYDGDWVYYTLRAEGVKNDPMNEH